MRALEASVRAKMKYVAKNGLSAAGLRVAMLLEEWDGLHHFDQSMLSKADWTDTYIVLRLRGMSTFDFNLLTRLVLLAHDYCIRVEIAPSNMQAVKVLFHPRSKRDGSMHERHPTIDSVLAEWREKRPVAAFEEHFAIAAESAASGNTASMSPSES